MYVKPPSMVLCRLFWIDLKNIFPIMVDMVGRSKAEQNILVGERWWLAAGVWLLGEGGVWTPATMAPRSLSTLE